jgi:hypothetical protein
LGNDIISDHLLQFWKALAPIFVMLWGIERLLMLLQPKNALAPMLVTVSGIETDSKTEQLENALAPMVLRLFGRLILVILVPENAFSPMLVMPSDRLMLLNRLQPAKALLGIAVPPTTITDKDCGRKLFWLTWLVAPKK